MPVGDPPGQAWLVPVLPHGRAGDREILTVQGGSMLPCIYEPCDERCEYYDCIDGDGICHMYEPDYPEEEDDEDEDEEEDDENDY